MQESTFACWSGALPDRCLSIASFGFNFSHAETDLQFVSECVSNSSTVLRSNNATFTPLTNTITFNGSGYAVIPNTQSILTFENGSWSLVIQVSSDQNATNMTYVIGKASNHAIQWALGIDIKNEFFLQIGQQTINVTVSNGSVVQPWWIGIVFKTQRKHKQIIFPAPSPVPSPAPSVSPKLPNQILLYSHGHPVATRVFNDNELSSFELNLTIGLSHLSSIENLKSREKV